MQFLPNVITVSRILVTPILVFCLFQQSFGAAVMSCLLFMFGAVSDFADGYVARAWKTQSQLGGKLDPVADKVLVLGSFAALAWLYPERIPWWGVGVIVLRDALVTGLRMIAGSGGEALRITRFAKIKTALQMIFLGLFLLVLALQYIPVTEEFSQMLFQSGFMYGFMILVVIVTLLTGLSYIRVYLQKPSTRQSLK